jgi:hypothetical protein
VKALVAELDSLLDGNNATSPPPVREPGPAAAAPATAPSPTQTSPIAGEQSSAAEAASRADLVATPAMSSSPQPSTGPRWWVWGSVGAAVVVGAVVAVLLLRTPDPTTIHDGSLGTLRH